MSSKKQRRRERRRAEKTVDEAMEAAQSGQLEFAERLMLRALEKGRHNARFWKEFADLLLAAGKPERAQGALRRCLELAPGYTEAQEALDQLLADEPRPQAAEQTPPLECAVAEPEIVFSPRSERYDWAGIEASLIEQGVIRLPALLDAAECGALRESFASDALFEHDVTLDDERGSVHYRFLRRPLPPPLPELRSELYARLAAVANRFNELLGKSERFPASFAGFARRCTESGQRRTSPILLRYVRGGFNAYHRDVYGTVFFPFQCAVSLGPSGVDGGGQLCLVDQRPGKKKRERRIATEAGDAVVFCTRERLCPIAGVYGLQPVLHGVSPVLAAERYALGLPFHDYAGD